MCIFCARCILLLHRMHKTQQGILLLKISSKVRERKNILWIIFIMQQIALLFLTVPYRFMVSFFLLSLLYVKCYGRQVMSLSLETGKRIKSLSAILSVPRPRAQQVLSAPQSLDIILLLILMGKKWDQSG